MGRGASSRTLLKFHPVATPIQTVFENEICLTFSNVANVKLARLTSTTVGMDIFVDGLKERTVHTGPTLPALLAQLEATLSSTAKGTIIQLHPDYRMVSDTVGVLLQQRSVARTYLLAGVASHADLREFLNKAKSQGLY